MQLHNLENIAVLRTVIGYLGEKEQYAWWQSSFFGAGSHAFLAPVFGRTVLLAQMTGITSAAARVHDEVIGVGDTFHLFRLPEDLEQDVHEFFATAASNTLLRDGTKNRDSALTYLRELAGAVTAETGPVRVGDLDAIRSPAAWEHATAHYAQAFMQSTKTFPYFATRA